MFFNTIDKKNEQDTGKYYSATKSERPKTALDFAGSQRTRKTKEVNTNAENGVQPDLSWLMHNR